MMKQLKRYTINMMMQTKKLYVIVAMAASVIIVLLFINSSDEFDESEVFAYEIHSKAILRSFEKFNEFNKSDKYRLYHNNSFKDFKNEVCKHQILDICGSEAKFDAIEIFKDSVIIYYFNTRIKDGDRCFLVTDPNNNYFEDGHYVSERNKKYLTIRKLNNSSYFVIQRYKDLTE